GARAVGGPRASQALAAARQHFGGAIDANEAHTGFCHRKRNASGAATELEDGTILRAGKPLPESHVAARDGTGILPVVEGRVLVPALPALRAAAAHATPRASEARSGSSDRNHPANAVLTPRVTGVARCSNA